MPTLISAGGDDIRCDVKPNSTMQSKASAAMKTGLEACMIEWCGEGMEVGGGRKGGRRVRRRMVVADRSNTSSTSGDCGSEDARARRACASVTSPAASTLRACVG